MKTAISRIVLSVAFSGVAMTTTTVALLLFIGQVVQAADTPVRVADKTAAGPAEADDLIRQLG